HGASPADERLRFVCDSLHMPGPPLVRAVRPAPRLPAAAGAPVLPRVQHLALARRLAQHVSLPSLFLVSLSQDGQLQFPVAASAVLPHERGPGAAVAREVLAPPFSPVQAPPPVFAVSRLTAASAFAAAGPIAPALALALSSASLH